MNKKVVIALGGNALGKTPSEQKKLVKKAAVAIVDLFQEGCQVLIVHGNGPQVGWINDVFNLSYEQKMSEEKLPLPECTAMSEGYIGFHIQEAIQNELKKRNIVANAVTLITEVIVNKEDQAFQNPSKPIGKFLSQKEAQELAKKNNWIFKEDAGRGFRHVVPSPKPIDIPLINAIQSLMKEKIITIVGGGGGIPIIEKNHYYKGIDAVIDKDATASFLAQKIEANIFIILTAVNRVMLNFGKSNQKALKNVSIKHLEKHLENQEFAEGSMLPKILAAKSFVEKTHNKAYIGSLTQAHNIFVEKSGTKIVK